MFKAALQIPLSGDFNIILFLISDILLYRYLLIFFKSKMYKIKNLLLMKKLLICMLFMLTFSLVTSGQLPVEKRNRYWFDFGYGPFLCKDAFGLSVMGMNFGYAIENKLFSCKSGFNYDFSNINFMGDSKPAEYFYDMGILYGVHETDNTIQCSLSAGIGIFGGAMNGEYLWDGSWVFNTDGHIIRKFNTINIPVEVQFNFIPTSKFGLGLNLFANLNTKRFLGGVLFKFRWGKLK